FDASDLFVAESFRAPRRPGRYLNAPVGEEKRRSEVIGRALAAKLAQDIELGGLALASQSAAKRSGGRVHSHDGTVSILRRLELLEGQLADGDAGSGLPQKSATGDMRMERAHEHRRSPQRYVAGNETLAQLRHHVLGANRRTRAV